MSLEIESVSEQQSSPSEIVAMVFERMFESLHSMKQLGKALLKRVYKRCRVVMMKTI